MNEKNMRASERDFFGKFIFFSNNSKNFINTDKYETRFWVRKIPALEEGEKNPKLMEEMYEEIPAFLYFLEERKLATERRTRSWFAHDLLKTDALQQVIEHSLPTVEKEIRTKVGQMFELDEKRMSITLTTSDISKEFFKGNKYEHNYINETCKRLGLEKANGGKVTRYSYPVLHENYDRASGEHKALVIEKTGFVGRPWEFKREDFVGADMEYDVELDAFSQEATEARANTPQTALPYKDNDNNDLPF